jgi:hypothetical protein
MMISWEEFGGPKGTSVNDRAEEVDFEEDHAVEEEANGEGEFVFNGEDL